MGQLVTRFRKLPPIREVPPTVKRVTPLSMGASGVDGEHPAPQREHPAPQRDTKPKPRRPEAAREL